MVPPPDADDDTYRLAPSGDEDRTPGDSPPPNRLFAERSFGKPLGGHETGTGTGQEPSENENTEDEEADGPTEQDLALQRSSQVSLAGVLLLLTIASVLLAAWPRLDPATYAGTMGGLVLVGLVLQSWLQPEAAWWRLGWWLLVAIYLAACGLALWRG